MIASRSPVVLQDLVRELLRVHGEAEWLEFKRNKAVPEEIGEYISALSNGASLAGRPQGYMIWGVCDGTHEVVGTTFEPRHAKKGNEELTSWLSRLLYPVPEFYFSELTLDAKRLVLLEVDHAMPCPVRFCGEEFIRIGSYKKKLKDFPEKERTLWRIFDQLRFEEGVAFENATDNDVLRLIDYPAAIRRGLYCSHTSRFQKWIAMIVFAPATCMPA